MNFSKKLKVIMMIVVICCTILVPITVFASNACSSQEFQIQNRQHSVTTLNHLYLYRTIENADGTEEYIYQDCAITITTDAYERKCKECKQVFKQQGSGEKKAHSNCEF